MPNENRVRQREDALAPEASEDVDEALRQANREWVVATQRLRSARQAAVGGEGAAAERGRVELAAAEDAVRAAGQRLAAAAEAKRRARGRVL